MKKFRTRIDWCSFTSRAGKLTRPRKIICVLIIYADAGEAHFNVNLTSWWRIPKGISKYIYLRVNVRASLLDPLL